MASLLMLLEVFLIIIAAAIVVLGFASGLEGWAYLAPLVLVTLVIVHLAWRNHRRELELHRTPAGLRVPEAPKVPTVPRVPVYDRARETRAPQPPPAPFPRQGGSGPRMASATPPNPRATVCRSCGSWVRSGSTFCQRCGRPVAP